mmetsp:Transcript_8413/g.12810  ORF Transcript_8413/g.12810 Transcript_8413/m.12810 type:complete len:106 (+) Transcript_8413:762-1079(+)
MEEFGNLIFSNDETFNVDLGSLKPARSVSQKKQLNTITGPPPMNENDPEKLMTQWKYYIKKSMKNLSNDLVRGDEDRTYQIEVNDLLKIIDKRTQVPGFLAHKRD